MTPEKLFEAIGQIDEERLEQTEMLEQSETKDNNDRIIKFSSIKWNRWATLAACACIAIVGIKLATNTAMSPNLSSTKDATMTEEMPAEAVEAEMAAEAPVTDYENDEATAYDNAELVAGSESADTIPNMEEGASADSADIAIPYIDEEGFFYIDGVAYLPLAQVADQTYDMYRKLDLGAEDLGDYISDVIDNDGTYLLLYEYAENSEEIYIVTDLDDRYDIYIKQ